MSFNYLQHGSISPGNIKVAGVEIKRTRIYCSLHGFYDLLVVSKEWFERNHGHCGEPLKPRGAEFERAKAA